MKKKLNNLIVSLAVALSVVALVPGTVYATDNCEENYGGGETCLINKRFKIEKWVRLEGDDDWEDEITIDLTDDDEEDSYVEFKIKITNKSDDYEDLDFDDMKMKDSLPDELERIGGDGLTEYWDNFDPGETKTFYIKVEIDEDEKDRDGEYEKCAVNKASVYWDGELEGSDTATVCWKNYEKEIKELPETGAETSLVGIAGLTIAALGAFIKKAKNSRN